MVTRLIFALLFILSAGARAQSLVYSEPDRLSSNINTAAEESAPLLAPDGKKLFFTRSLHEGNVGGKFSGHDIWISERDGNAWGKADNRKFKLNNKNNNAVIGMNAEGTVLYLMDASSNRKTAGIYFAKKEANGWSHPEFLPLSGIENAGFVNFHVSSDFTVILVSMKGLDTQGEEDLYISVKDGAGQWPSPRNIGTAINTKGFEISPFLSPDKKKLYFASNGHAGSGDADIFVSERLYESWEVWTSPQNLGDKVNSRGFDAYYSTYGDTVGYFSSNREGKSADLFVTHISKPVVVVKKEVVRLYLSDKETTALGIPPVNLLYDPNTSDLTEAQKISLVKVATLLQSKKDLLCGLIALRRAEATDLEIYQKRLLAVLDLLKRTGLEGSRITFGIEKTDKLGPKDKESVAVKFYRQ